MSRRFIKNIEHFTCAHCGASVTGDGFTNHCPHCLWSKHVDVYPGDRQELCSGLMEPVGLEMKRRVYRITHRCTQCGKICYNRSEQGDNLSILLA